MVVGLQQTVNELETKLDDLTADDEGEWDSGHSW
jgi:hypothetical protein